LTHQTQSLVCGDGRLSSEPEGVRCPLSGVRRPAREYLCNCVGRMAFRCPRCGCERVRRFRAVLLRCRDCRHQTSVTGGDDFSGHPHFSAVVVSSHMVVVSQKNGVSALGLQRVLGLKSYETAWTWLHKLRRAMVRPGRDLLTGRSRWTMLSGWVGGGAARAAQLEESTDCGCCPRGWALGSAGFVCARF